MTDILDSNSVILESSITTSQMNNANYGVDMSLITSCVNTSYYIDLPIDNAKQCIYILEQLALRLSKQYEVPIQDIEIEALQESIKALKTIDEQFPSQELDIKCKNCKDGYIVITDAKENKKVVDDDGHEIGEAIITGFKPYCPTCGYLGPLCKSSTDCKELYIFKNK